MRHFNYLKLFSFVSEVEGNKNCLTSEIPIRFPIKYGRLSKIWHADELCKLCILLAFWGCIACKTKLFSKDRHRLNDVADFVAAPLEYFSKE